MGNKSLPIESYNDNYGTITTQAQSKRKGNALRNTIIVIASILILLALSAAVVFILILQTPNSDKFTATPNNDALYTLVKSAIYDNDAEISSGELSSFAVYLIEQANNVKEQNGEEPLPIKDIAFFIHNDKPCEIYAMVEKDSQTYEISGEFEISPSIVDDKIELKLKSAKLGALPLPRWLALDCIFNDDSFAKNSGFLERKGNSIYLNASYSFELLGQDINLAVTKAQASDNTLIVKTTSAADIILGSLESWLNSLF
ncbi:hypothetical protein [Ruminococcus sp. zg-924]|uniref:hypothetical protein n=1 Tax=Ruminococcus sp. zg-924 TaxID=2678505 RepID=UPI00210894E6|nr:hypothetical protein [Ruminococcus sp. zg-924]MCQ4022316.1 hypothetical protein [Ruminococcus sp. zg-924]